MKDAGRSNKPGNMKGAKKPIHIAMKDPMKHLKMGGNGKRGHSRKSY